MRGLPAQYHIERYNALARRLSHFTTQLGPLPPPYPSSWFRICWSEELSGRVTKVKTFGRLLRVGRSPSSKRVHVVDYCCASQGRGPPFACTVHQPAALRVEELLGVVLAWHGETLLPTWELPSVLLDLRAAPLVYHGHTQHKIPCHVQVRIPATSKLRSFSPPPSLLRLFIDAYISCRSLAVSAGASRERSRLCALKLRSSPIHVFLPTIRRASLGERLLASSRRRDGAAHCAL